MVKKKQIKNSSKYRNLLRDFLSVRVYHTDTSDFFTIQIEITQWYTHNSHIFFFFLFLQSALKMQKKSFMNPQIDIKYLILHHLNLLPVQVPTRILLYFLFIFYSLQNIHKFSFKKKNIMQFTVIILGILITPFPNAIKK